VFAVVYGEVAGFSKAIFSNPRPSLKPQVGFEILAAAVA